MSYKKSTLVVDDVKYIYTVTEYSYFIKIIVYQTTDKNPFFTAYINYAEAWGFDVYRPKTIEVLIKFYRENNASLTKNEFKIKENPLLFEQLLQVYFADSSEQEIERFRKACDGKTT